MKYRSEIDGLRVIAVIPVILFHAGLSTFSGGFVGVDVFFVISGYLITTIILSEMEQGKFSLLAFYERRARRILPALFLVMLVSLPFAWFWLLPKDMKDFSQSLVAVSSFSSNFLFWRESGYWDTASELKPLLHTWSLAVEEQYYVLFPLFLMLMWNYRKRWILGAFILIAGTSLATAQWGAYYKPSAAFYLLPTRGWELAIGAGIAFYFLYRKQAIRTLLSHKLIDEVLGLLGLMMIGYGIFVFDETTPFPGFYALVPTIGAGLIILFSSSQTMVGRLLGSKPLVALGLISYSAYLWHQPLLAFTRHGRHGMIVDLSEMTYAIIAFLSFPFAYLSWKYVEQPFRNGNGLSRKPDPYTHLTPRHPAATLPAHESLWPMVRHPPTRAHPGCRASGAHPQPPRPGGTGV
jgi:peptidoglycan/LPS O-acetylase OafA/YrhL